MAKIVVFSDAIIEGHARTHFSRQIVNHAAETANEIYFVTHNNEEDDLSGYHPKVQILRPFRSWTILEAAKLLPILFQLKADIFHFVQPQKKIGLNHAFPVLAAFAHSLNTQNILSLIDFEPKLSRGLEALILTSQLISVIDPSQASFLTQRFQKLRIECLPARAFQDWTYSDEQAQLGAEAFIFLPENLHQYQNPFLILKILVNILSSHPNLHLVCSGSLLNFDLKTRRRILQSLGPIAPRIQWTGPLTQKKKLLILKKSELVLLAGLRFSPQLIHENLSLVLGAQSATILSPNQVTTSQIHIVNDVHAKVVEDSEIESALRTLLGSPEKCEVMRNNLASLKQLHSEDELGNQLSRIYAKLLS